MNSNKEIDSHSAQDIMDIVKASTSKILDVLNDGDKTTLKDLIDKVVADTKIQISTANGLVPMIVRQWCEDGGGTVNKGRNGGVFKGGKRSRVDARQRCQTCNQVVRKIIVKTNE